MAFVLHRIHVRLELRISSRRAYSGRVLHERFSLELKAWIDLYGIVLFVLPFTALMLIYGIPFVVDSYETKEVSPSPGGLELRWLSSQSWCWVFHCWR
ncbi:MAG: hypothetical protein Ct9H300mP8_07140 [Gammaproteobacteria bacterium]|nr:MAG: hypothetical protein Ct9H300mP8_07140 [Gammaproteobacteria bacterium]